MNNLIKIQKLQTLLQFEIPDLKSPDLQVSKNAKDRVDTIIKTASQNIIEEIGYNPVSDTTESRTFQTLSYGDTLFFKIPTQEILSISLVDKNGDRLGALTFEKINPFCIKVDRELRIGERIKIDAFFGKFKTVDELDGSNIELLCGFLCSSLLKRQGIVSSSNVGASSQTYRAGYFTNDKEVIQTLFGKEKKDDFNMIELC